MTELPDKSNVDVAPGNAPDHRRALDELGERLELAMDQVDRAWAPFAATFRRSRPRGASPAGLRSPENAPVRPSTAQVARK